MAEPDQRSPQRPSGISIELRPHIGVMRNSKGGLVEIEHPQWMVVATLPYFYGQIGFLRQEEGSPLLPIDGWRKVADADREALLSLIGDSCGWDVTAIPIARRT